MGIEQEKIDEITLTQIIKDGRKAAIKGDPKESGYILGSTQDKAWMASYNAEKNLDNP